MHNIRSNDSLDFQTLKIYVENSKKGFPKYEIETLTYILKRYVNRDYK